MPARFIIDPQRKTVYSQATGVFVYVDYLGHMSDLVGDPRFRPEYNHLVDCRASTLSLTSDQIRELASRSVFNAGSRRAFLVSSDYQFGLGRMFAAFREFNAGQEIMVFREMREALAWLNLPSDLDPFATNESTGDAGST